MKRLATTAVVLALVGAWSAWPGSLPRRFVHDLRNEQCHKGSSTGGVVALGDSLTRMNSDPAWGFEGTDSWYGLGVCSGKIRNGYNAGVYGDTTARMLARWQRDVANHDPSVVVILGGTNDLLGRVPVSVTLSNLAVLMAHAQALPAVVVVGLVPAPAGVDPGRVSALNSGIRTLAVRDDVRLVDFAAAVTSTVDGVHPTHASAEAMLRVYLTPSRPSHR